MRQILSSSQCRSFSICICVRGHCADQFYGEFSMKIALTLAAVASLGLLAACGQKAAEPAATTAAAPAADAMAAAGADAVAAGADKAAEAVQAGADKAADAAKAAVK
jgi:hypothetical protein